MRPSVLRGITNCLSVSPRVTYLLWVCYMAKTPKQKRAETSRKTKAKASSTNSAAARSLLRRMDIEAQIRYEEAPGVHTYHACQCGRQCRRTKCAWCWKKALREH